MRTIRLSVALALALAGCASSSSSTTTASSNTIASTRGTVKRTNVISTQEISTSNVHNAFQLVRSIRPQWSGSYRIFIGETLYGGTLNDLDPADYKEIRYYTPSEAQMKFVAVRGASAGTGLLAAIQLVKR